MFFFKLKILLCFKFTYCFFVFLSLSLRLWTTWGNLQDKSWLLWRSCTKALIRRPFRDASMSSWSGSRMGHSSVPLSTSASGSLVYCALKRKWWVQKVGQNKVLRISSFLFSPLFLPSFPSSPHSQLAGWFSPEQLLINAVHLVVLECKTELLVVI